jgi:hypothetical protein
LELVHYQLERQFPVALLHFMVPSDRVVITMCSGKVSRGEVETSLTELRQHPNFRPDFGQLADLLHVSNLDLRFEDIKAIHRRYDPFSHEARRAVVAHGGSAPFELAWMYQLIVNSAQFEVFQSMLDALEWLHLKVTTLEAAYEGKLAAGKQDQSLERMVLVVPHDVPTSLRKAKK